MTNSQQDTRDAFTTAARAEAEGRWPRVDRRNKSASEWLDEGTASGFVLGAQWARDHLAAEIRKAQADAWQAGVNFALPSTETTHLARHNPHRTQESR